MGAQLEISRFEEVTAPVMGSFVWTRSRLSRFHNVFSKLVRVASLRSFRQSGILVGSPRFDIVSAARQLLRRAFEFSSSLSWFDSASVRARQAHPAHKASCRRVCSPVMGSNRPDQTWDEG